MIIHLKIVKKPSERVAFFAGAGFASQSWTKDSDGWAQGSDQNIK
jgi:hypothetical protein